MDIGKMENSELLAYFLIKRDNLTLIKRRMYDGEEGLEELFDLERKEYEDYLKEIYWRLNHGKKSCGK